MKTNNDYRIILHYNNNNNNNKSNTELSKKGEWFVLQLQLVYIKCIEYSARDRIGSVRSCRRSAKQHVMGSTFMVHYGIQFQETTRTIYMYV